MVDDESTRGAKHLSRVATQGVEGKFRTTFFALVTKRVTRLVYVVSVAEGQFCAL
jgi:hypothetical protein